MFELLSTFSLAAAGGMGFLAVKHHKQFKELAGVVVTFAVIIGILAFVIMMTIDLTAMEFMFEIDSDKRDEVMAIVESWKSGWNKVALFCGGTFVYTGVLWTLSDSIEEERKSNLQDTNNSENGAEVSESD